MADLPARPDIAQLRRQAKELLRGAKRGSESAARRIAVVSDRLTLSSAQLALARDYGFPSWARLKLEVERREALNRRDLVRLRAMLDESPALAIEPMKHWSDHRRGVPPLTYIATIRFNARRLGLTPDLAGTGEIARTLLERGAPVDGRADDDETPLMTAASYGDAEVARVLIELGADLDATATPTAGGVPGGSALLHAAVFGMTEVLDQLVAAGALVRSVEEAAACGDLTGWLESDTPMQVRIRALVFAADQQRIDVIDELIAAGTPVDAVDEDFGRQALRTAAQHGRPRSVRCLLAHGADPAARDTDGLTALDLANPKNRYLDHAGHREVEAILRS